MAKLLGRPANVAAGQLRLMVPILVISAFLNNTPVVVLMIPICQKWGKNVGISPAQLLMPLSFASILGGTCTLIGMIVCLRRHTRDTSACMHCD